MDPNAFSAAVVDIVRGFLERELDPVLAKIATFEARLAALPTPKDGRDGVDGKDGAAGRDGLNGKDGVDGSNGKDGVDGAPGRDGLDGKDGAPGKDGNHGEPGADGRAGEPGERGPEGPAGKDGIDGKDGKDADPITREQIVDAVLSMPEAIAAAVEEYLAANPPPAGDKGDKGDCGEPGQKGIPGERGLDGAAGPAGRNGADGIGLASMIIDRSGNLVATMTDGSTKELGLIVGQDGRDGSPGKDGADGSPGRDGKDGADGLGFEDLDLVETDAGIFLRFMRGEQMKEFRLPVVVDRGVWKDGQTYRAGDGVTWGGSFWICQAETVDKPDSGKGFRLAVKKGRDGKDGIVKDAPKPVPVKVG